MKIKTLALLFSLVAPLAAHADDMAENISLAKQSHHFAVRLKELEKAEQVAFCQDHIDLASGYSEYAAEYLMADSTFLAKLSLKWAIDKLAYTVVEDCSEADNILAAKIELTKLYDSIM